MAERTLKLMIPGPVQPDADVMAAFAQPVQPHYGPQWRDLYLETTAMLQKVFGTGGDVFLLVGSGSAAVDACIGTSMPAGATVIIGVNGAFGERLRTMALGYDLDVVTVEAELGQPLRAGDFEDALRRHPGARLVGLCHVETSTTALNPVEEVAAAARRHGVPCMVDAVSSLGGLPMKMDEWGIDFCAAASQKCLGAPPGLGPVAVSANGWDAVERNAARGRGWFLDLRVWRQYAHDWADWHPHPSTMATNNVAALRVSLRKLLDEGVDARLARYRTLALHLRAGLRRIGLQPFTPDELMAPVLTAAHCYPGVKAGEIVTYLADVHGIKITTGFGEALHDRIIRIGHMAPDLGPGDIEEVLNALEAFRERMPAGQPA